MGSLFLRHRLVAFDPLRFSTGDLAAWFRADTGVTFDVNRRVTRWEDSSGRGRALTQGAGGPTNRPLWESDQVSGRPAVRFDGSNYYLTTGDFGLTQPETIYMVVKFVAWASNRIIMDGTAVNKRMLVQWTGSSPTMQMYAGASFTNSAAVFGTFGVATWAFNGTTSFFQIGAGEETMGNAGTQGAGGLTLGIGYDITSPGSFQVAELLVFSSAHAADRRRQMRQYLSQRYAVSI